MLWHVRNEVVEHAAVRDPALRGQLPRIVCVTHSRFTCWNPAPICGRSNCCSVHNISRPLYVMRHDCVAAIWRRHTSANQSCTLPGFGAGFGAAKGARQRAQRTRAGRLKVYRAATCPSGGLFLNWPTHTTICGGRSICRPRTRTPVTHRRQPADAPRPRSVGVRRRSCRLRRGISAAGPIVCGRAE
jgi:hypothetical protein